MNLSPKIVYEDNDLLVIDKPSGVVVNRAETVGGETVQEWAEKKVLSIKDKQSLISRRRGIKALSIGGTDFIKRAGIVHRLDKETSGLLIIAKNEESFLELQRQFKEREVEKKYLALSHGEVKPKEGKIEAPIQRSPFNREKFGVFLGGKPGVTKYQVLKYYKIDKEILTFLKVIPETGRTHQIRVHFKYINHPIVSDEVYAGRKTARNDRKWCPRLFLHAYYLKFKQPKTKKEILLRSELPKELKLVLERFQFCF